MKRSVFVLTIIMLLSLLASSTAMAKGGIGKLPKWEQVFDPVPIYGDGDFWPYLVTFNNLLIAGPFYSEAEGTDQLWASEDGENWRLAWSASEIQEGGSGIWAPMYVFKNRLYVQVIVCMDDENCEARIVRTRNGQSWEKVYWSTPETDFPSGFTSYQGYLYIWWTSHLLRSRSGDPGTWQEVAEFPGLAFGSFETFKGSLYMNSADVYDADGNSLPAQIWHSFDGANWELVVSDGFGDPNNILGGSLGQKDNYLYASVGSWDNSADIYRSKDGVNWEPVTTDGFGDPVINFGSFVTYRNQIIVYGADWGGCRVYASFDGLTWKPVNEPGWGEARNIGVIREWGRAIFKGNLYTATVGPGGVYRLGAK